MPIVPSPFNSSTAPGIYDRMESLDPIDGATLLAVNPTVTRTVLVITTDLGTEGAVIALGGLLLTVVQTVEDPNTEVAKGSDAGEYKDNLFDAINERLEQIPAANLNSIDSTSFEIVFAPGAAANDIECTNDDPNLAIENGETGADSEAGTIAYPVFSYIIPCGDESTPLEASVDPVVTFWPFQAMTIVAVRASVTVPTTGDPIVIGVEVDNVPVTDGQIHIPADELVDDNEAPVQSPSVLENSILKIYVPDGTGDGAGLKVVILYRLA